MSEKNDPNAEIHLFIIWEHARPSERRILEDISKNFDILRKYEISWSEKHFPQNLSRFYGSNLPPNSRKEQHCGTGPFLAVVVEDKAPKYHVRTTSKGDESVNTKMFDAKTRHREWTGGGHRIHGSNSVIEADQNLTLLLGKNSRDLRSEIGNDISDVVYNLSRELEGHDGWRDLRHLFYVLNSTLEYVVLRNFEPFPDKYYADEHGDIDILVRDFKDARFVLNAKPVFSARHRVHVTVPIASEDVRFDLRYVGDGYYDSRWQDNMLNTRVLQANCFYTPTTDNHFFGLLYHALVQKPAIAEDYGKRLIAASGEVGLSIGTHKLDQTKAMNAIASLLKKRKYYITQPIDKSVYVNMNTVKYAKSLGVSYRKSRKIPPIRNYLKTAKSKSRHYFAKTRRIINRNINKITSKNYGKKD